jgi:integrase
LVPAQIAAGVSFEIAGAHGKPVARAKYPGLHSLRHFFANWCINQKVDGGLELPTKVVQERLGHSTIAMTLDVYGLSFQGKMTAESWRRRNVRCSDESPGLMQLHGIRAFGILIPII